MYCPKCGKENNDNAAFCSSCGGKLNAPQAAEAAKEAPIVTTTATGSVTTGDGSTTKAAKKTGRTIGIIFAAVIVVAVVVTAAMTEGFGLLGNGSGVGSFLSSGPQVKDSVNDYSWDELSKVSAEISEASSEGDAIEVAKKYNLTTADGKLDGTQTKSITLSDGTDANVRITGFWHDDKTNGGKAGITFIFKDAIARHDMNSSNSNSGGWKDSQMRAWLASDGINMLPDDLKGVLIEVDKKTNNVGETESTASVSTTSDKLWLYSATELCGKVDWSSTSAYNDIINAEGAEYKLYRDMSVNSAGSNGILVKWFEGDSCNWWGRSPRPNLSGDFCVVTYVGIPRGSGNASFSGGVVPGFCI